MFRGDSCYPISPHDKNEPSVSKNDQLTKILKKHPLNDEELDLCFLDGTDQYQYIKDLRLQMENSKIDETKSCLKTIFSDSDPDMV